MSNLLQINNISTPAQSLSELLQNPHRSKRLRLRIDGLLADLSRVRLDEPALDALLKLTRDCGLEQRRDDLFAGAPVNNTEGRPALHMALRSPDVLAAVGGQESVKVASAMETMLALAQELNAGKLPGVPGGRVTDIVHTGIGGSLLGPQLLCEALAPTANLRVHFLGSVDAYRRERLVRELDPTTTLVLLVSKSFTTGDTLLHGRRMRDWLVERLGHEAAADRIYAVTSQVERATAFGIAADRLLYFPEWVGGRYSVWSPVSLAAAALAGPEQFRAFLQGGAAMDQHFRVASLDRNLPVLLALAGVWHRNVCGYSSWGVMPYDQRLRLLPAFLQQLIMESNGKSVTRDGRPAPLATSPVVFGETGTEAQHSVFQAMHQGSDIVPLHFIGVVRPAHADREAHDELLANLLAQLTALATGRDADATRRIVGEISEDLLAQRVFAGNRPSELLLLDELDAHTLGQLLALYEHKVFAESVLWDINAFDQWGVELGKTLAPGIQSALAADEDSVPVPGPGLMPLLDHIRQVRKS